MRNNRKGTSFFYFIYSTHVVLLTFFQSEIITYAPAAASSVAMAIYSGIYNLGIGSGTWIGGSICTHLSISYIGMVGGVIAVVAALLCIFVVIKYMKEFDRAS